jgi:Aspartyl protease
MTRGACAAALWVVLGCGEPPVVPESPGPSATAEAPQPSVRSAAIVYQTPDGDPFAYPVVHATVRGVDTALIVDTGASHTVVDTWLLEQLGVRLVEAEDTEEGHAGERVTAYRAEAPKLAVAGLGSTAPAEVLGVKLPLVFRHLGLGGVLSPQSLASAGEHVVVDLVGRRLRIEPAGGTRGSRPFGEAEPCPVGTAGAMSAVFLVDAQVSGHPARLVVDSGAAQTDLLVGSKPGQALVGRSTEGSPSFTVGGRVQARRLRGARLEIGQVATTVELALMPGSSTGACPRDGHLGLDVLRHCVLRLAPDHFEAHCVW